VGTLSDTDRQTHTETDVAESSTCFASVASAQVRNNNNRGSYTSSKSMESHWNLM